MLIENVMMLMMMTDNDLRNDTLMKKAGMFGASYKWRVKKFEAISFHYKIKVYVKWEGMEFLRYSILFLPLCPCAFCMKNKKDERAEKKVSTKKHR